jgi:hypothetical protein
MLEPLARAHRSFNAQPRMRRELILFGPALIFGLVGVPLLIWVVGTRVLGPYMRGTKAHDRPLALVGDFFAGLAHGSTVFWLVALGPALFVALVRLLALLIRWGDRWAAGRDDSGAPPPPAPAGARPASSVTRPPQVAKQTPESRRRNLDARL